MHPRKDGDKSQADEARTPPSLFAKLDKRFEFMLDACCTRSNCLVFRGIFHEGGYDALKEDWNKISLGGSVYCNPPYSNPEPFIIKAYEESLKGCIVVLLLPADTSTKVFHHYTMKASEIIFIEGRVVFNNPDGTRMKGSPKFGSMVAVFDKSTFAGKPVIGSMGWK